MIKFKIYIPKKLLIKYYLTKRLSIAKIANILKCNVGTIYKRLKYYNIQIRNKSEAQFGLKRSQETINKRVQSRKGYRHSEYTKNKIRKSLLGHIGLKADKNPFFIHGKSQLPYTDEFCPSLKYLIRKRDDFTCQYCGIVEEKHLLIYKQNLHIHHIDYNKLNCNKNNLITLCKSCHGKSHFNRDYWFAYYKYTIKEFYNV